MEYALEIYATCRLCGIGAWFDVVFSSFYVNSVEEDGNVTRYLQLAMGFTCSAEKPCNELTQLEPLPVIILALLWMLELDENITTHEADIPFFDTELSVWSGARFAVRCEDTDCYASTDVPIRDLMIRKGELGYSVMGHAAIFCAVCDSRSVLSVYGEVALEAFQMLGATFQDWSEETFVVSCDTCGAARVLFDGLMIEVVLGDAAGEDAPWVSAIQDCRVLYGCSECRTKHIVPVEEGMPFVAFELLDDAGLDVRNEIIATVCDVHGPILAEAYPESTISITVFFSPQDGETELLVSSLCPFCPDEDEGKDGIAIVESDGAAETLLSSVGIARATRSDVRPMKLDEIAGTLEEIRDAIPEDFASPDGEGDDENDERPVNEG